MNMKTIKLHKWVHVISCPTTYQVKKYRATLGSRSFSPCRSESLGTTSYEDGFLLELIHKDEGRVGSVQGFGTENLTR
jgi:hypothetical protein